MRNIEQKFSLINSILKHKSIRYKNPKVSTIKIEIKIDEQENSLIVGYTKINLFLVLNNLSSYYEINLTELLLKINQNLYKKIIFSVRKIVINKNL
ncbi:MAG TPA: hypothetical protein PKU92_08675 [Agitococcus sp.]|nr:hypothetical protein [Agitococcus sp.]